MFRTLASKAFTPEGKTLATIAFLIAVPFTVLSTGYDFSAVPPEAPLPVVVEVATDCSTNAGVIACHEG